jgi:hypothetical protein
MRHRAPTHGSLDLSQETVEQLPYEVQTPDTFFVLVDDSAPEKVRTVTRKQSEHWLEKTGEADLPARLPIQPVGSNAVCWRISKLEHLVRARFCAPGRNRTYDRQIRRLLLYPLSYGGWELAVRASAAGLAHHCSAGSSAKARSDVWRCFLTRSLAAFRLHALRIAAA